MSPGARSNLLPIAGLFVAPALWVVSTQAGPALPYLSCGSSFRPAALVPLVAACLALAAGYLSWRSTLSKGFARAELAAYPQSFRFVALIGALAACLFAYALALQGLAALVLSGCER